MDKTDKDNLQKLISDYDIEDTTQEIRNSKHSDLIKNDVNTLLNIKSHYKGIKDSKIFDEISKKRVNFLYTKYHDLYKKILFENVDLNILYKFLDVLKKIEDGKVDQHEGSYEVGQLLKKIYVDKEIYKRPKKTQKKPVKKISWNEFKNLKDNV